VNRRSVRIPDGHNPFLNEIENTSCNRSAGSRRNNPASGNGNDLAPADSAGANAQDAKTYDGSHNGVSRGYRQTRIGGQVHPETSRDQCGEHPKHQVIGLVYQETWVDDPFADCTGYVPTCKDSPQQVGND